MSNANAATMAAGVTLIVLAVAGAISLNGSWSDPLLVDAKSQTTNLLAPNEQLFLKPAYLAFDWKKAEDRLRKIGIAIKRYRSEQKVLPIAEWDDLTDTGLPAALFELLQPGHEWSLELEDLIESGQPDPVHPKSSDYLEVAWYPDRNNRYDFIWAERGEKLPILLDIRMYNGSNLFQAYREPLDVLVLRMDGTVEKTKFSPFDYINLKLRR